MGANERERERIEDALEGPVSSSEVEDALLDSVLNHTADRGGNLELIQSIARQSKIAKGSDIESVREVVRGVLNKSFPKLSLSRGLVEQISQTLFESPEVREKLQRIWAQARSEGAVE